MMLGLFPTLQLDLFGNGRESSTETDGGRETMAVDCIVCGQPVERTGKRGPAPNVHRACQDLRLDLDRLRRHVAALADGTHGAKLTPGQLAELRYELFCLASEVPRPRDAQGRYVSSGVSSEYDRAVRRRKRASNPTQ